MLVGKGTQHKKWWEGHAAKYQVFRLAESSGLSMPGVWLCLRREEQGGSDRERGRRATLATKTDRGHKGASAWRCERAWDGGQKWLRGCSGGGFDVEEGGWRAQARVLSVIC